LGELFRRLAVRRQRLPELLFDAQNIGGGARPDFAQRILIALAPGRERERVARRRAAGVTRRTGRSPWRGSIQDPGNSKVGAGKFTDINEEARDHARSLKGTPEFEQSSNERKKVEMRFAHLKVHRGFERMRLRGLTGARDEFHLAAIVQNLKTLANHAWHPPPDKGAACAA
jgi:hypothetical protein